MLSELNVLLSVGLVVLTYTSIVLCVTGVIRLISNPRVEEVKREYEERIKNLREQVEELREMLKMREEQHRRELEDVLRHSKMIVSVKSAIDQGLVALKCREHNEEAEILVDGTIICRRGHRIWPTEGGGG